MSDREPRYLYSTGTDYFRVGIYRCDGCGGEMSAYEEYDDNFYCPNCSFKMGLISSKEYLRSCGVLLDTARAEVHDGEIYAVFNGKFPWEKNNKDYRMSKEYKDWREAVFVRDGFRCQICGKVGGELNAHHIKHFKDFPAERLNVDNGVTLCCECHRELHRKERNNG